MRIDAATYLGDWPLRPLSATVRELLAMLSASPVDGALVSPFSGLFYSDPTPANVDLLRQVEGRPNLWAAPIINALMADAARQVALLAEHPQVRAVRLAPGFHGYSLAQADGIAHVAAEHGLAVIVQLRLQDERSHPVTSRVPPVPPEEVIALATRHPKARVVVAAAKLAEFNAHKDALRARPNLWLDISHLDGLECLRRTCRALGAKKLLFASSWPFFYAKSAELKVVEAELSAEDAARPMGENAEEVFGL